MEILDLVRTPRPSNTVPMTLWSSTLMDILVDDLQQQKADGAVMTSVRGLYRKRIHPARIVKVVRRALGTETAIRLKNIITSHSTEK